MNVYFGDYKGNYYFKYLYEVRVRGFPIFILKII